MTTCHETAFDGPARRGQVLSAQTMRSTAAGMRQPSTVDDALSTAEVVTLSVEWICVAVVLVLCVRMALRLSAWIAALDRDGADGEGAAENDPR